jgi:hypothetical protein
MFGTCTMPVRPKTDRSGHAKCVLEEEIEDETAAVGTLKGSAAAQYPLFSP